MLIFSGLNRAIDGFPLDDAWIHQVVARTFGTTGTLGYAPGQHGAGATSYLWAALLAVNYAVFHASPFAYTLALNLALMIGTGHFLLAIVLRSTKLDSADTNATDEKGSSSEPLASKLGAVAAVALASFGGNVVWFAFSGMEATLFSFLCIAAIALYTRAEGERWSAWAAGILAGLVALTRPEAIPFALSLAAATKWSGRPRRHALFVLAPWAIALAAYVGSNYAATGQALPATLSGRRWMWLQVNGGWSRLQLGVEFFDVWVMRLRNYTLGTSSNAVLWASLGFALAGIVRAWRSKNVGLRWLMVWAASHVALFAVLMPTPGHGGRYQPLTPLLFLFFAGLGLVALAEGIVSRTAWRGWARPVSAVIATTPLFVCVLVGLVDWRSDHAKAVLHIRQTELGLASFVNRLPEGERVASFDIGGVGFASKRPIIDIGGLSDARTAALLQEGRIWEQLRDQKIDYVILPTSYRSDLPHPTNFGYALGLLHHPAIELDPVFELETPLEIWAPGIGATWNASPKQTVSRVRFTGANVTELRPPSKSEMDRIDDTLKRIGARDRATANYSLAILATHGAPVRVRLTPVLDERVPDEDAWDVRLGPWGVRGTPPKRAERDAEAFRAMLTETIEPYITANDLGGAVRMVAHVVATIAHRTERLMPFFTRQLVREPDTKEGVPDCERTAAWGLVILFLAFAAPFVTASRMREKIRGIAARIWVRVGGPMRRRGRATEA